MQSKRAPTLLFGQAIYARIVLPTTPEVKGIVCPIPDTTGWGRSLTPAVRRLRR
jgi:hypothetical protein